MAFTSSTFSVGLVASESSARQKKRRPLRKRHKMAMEQVLADAKKLAEDRKRTLEAITDPALRVSAR